MDVDLMAFKQGTLCCACFSLPIVLMLFSRTHESTMSFPVNFKCLIEPMLMTSNPSKEQSISCDHAMAFSLVPVISSTSLHLFQLSILFFICKYTMLIINTRLIYYFLRGGAALYHSARGPVLMVEDQF